jgi:rhomboid protease GluP
LRKPSGAIVCPSCRRLIDVREPGCPYCGRSQPGLFGYGPALTRLLGGVDVVRIVAGACVLLYLAALLMDLPGALAPRSLLGILAPSSRALFTLGMTGGIAWARGHYWTLLSAIYLHGGLLHLLFNVLWIRDLGPTVEEIYGPGRAFLLFTGAGVGGFLVSNLVSGAPTIGASGSIFGLLAALIVHGRKAGHVGLSAQMLRWAGILFVMGFLIPSVNNFAHLGGFATGWGIAFLFKGGTTHEGPLTTVAAIGAAVAAAAAIVLSVVIGF